MFVLVTDVLSAMFKHALDSKILIGVPLGEGDRCCNLHYANDLLIITTGGLEDLRIIKLMLFLFNGMTGLATNFAKTSFYLSRWGKFPDQAAVDTLQYAVGMLPVTYLGLPISGRRPRRQYWEVIISKVRRRLASWKGLHLSLGVGLHLSILGYLRFLRSGCLCSVCLVGLPRKLIAYAGISYGLDQTWTAREGVWFAGKIFPGHGTTVAGAS